MNQQQAAVPAPAASESESEERRKERIKAEARAYALSSATSRRRKRPTPTPYPIGGPPLPYPMYGVPSGRYPVAPPLPPSAAAYSAYYGPPPYAAAPRPSHPTRMPSVTQHLHPASGGPSHHAPQYPDAPQYPIAVQRMTSEGPPPAEPLLPSIVDPPPSEAPDDYQQFVQSLAWDEDLANLMDSSSIFAADDEEDEFQLGEDDEEEDEEEDEDDDDDEERDENERDENHGNPEPIEGIAGDSASKPISSDPRIPSSIPRVDGDLKDWEREFAADADLEMELNWLEEEDWEAAVATLMMENQPKPVSELDGACRPCDSSNKKDEASLEDSKKGDEEDHEFRQTLAGSRLRPSAEQRIQLEGLLQKHYQLLLQQAVLATRAAHFQRKSWDQRSDVPTLPPSCSESAEDLAEILDGAVGMLQDLNQNRKDAIRYYIQFADATRVQSEDHVTRRALWSQTQGSRNHPGMQSPGERRLTRSQFSKTLDDRFVGEGLTVFAIPGISKLNDTFSCIDKSVAGLQVGNILELPSHAAACTHLLVHAGSAYSLDLIPSSRDLSEHFIDVKDYFGNDFKPPCTADQESILRRSRNMFTSGEDNLVMRGVNLYGEKQWLLVADRFLPDRSAHIVSQRYNRICTLLYKANGVKINDEGNLETPPKCETVDDVDPAKLLAIQRVGPPAILNVHRWSLEEDLSVLKAVLVLGSMWAEIAARVLPHRDRGHIRKRYQVLSRRVRSAVQRTSKCVESLRSPQKPVPLQECRSNPKSPVKSPTTTKRFIHLSPTRSPSVSAGANRLAMGAVTQAAAILANARNTPLKGSHRIHVGASSTSKPARQPHLPTTPSFAKTTAMSAPSRDYTTPSKSRPVVMAAAGLHDEGSRAAFELLAAGGSPGWSQMAPITEMIRLDHLEEPKAATTAPSVTEFSDTPVQARRMPSSEYSPMNLHDDPCGLSILQSPLGATPVKATSELGDIDANREHGSSIGGYLAGVTDRTRSYEPYSQTRVQGDPRPSGPQRAPLERQDAGPPSTYFLQSLPPPPGGARYDSRTSGAAGTATTTGDASVSFPPFFSPEDTRSRPVYTAPPADGARPTYHSFGGPSSSLNSPPLTLGTTTVWGSYGYPAPPGYPPPAWNRDRDGEGLRSGAGERRRSRSSRDSSTTSSASASLSTPGAATPTSTFSRRSAGAGEESNATAGGLTPQSLFGGGGEDGVATLMETDLEAISTLNSLSHSPAEPSALLLFDVDRGHRRWDGDDGRSSHGDTFSPAAASASNSAGERPMGDITTAGTTSLFAKVVGVGEARPASSTAGAPSSVKKRRLCF